MTKAKTGPKPKRKPNPTPDPRRSGFIKMCKCHHPAYGHNWAEPKHAPGRLVCVNPGCTKSWGGQQDNPTHCAEELNRD